LAFFLESRTVALLDRLGRARPDDVVPIEVTEVSAEPDGLSAFDSETAPRPALVHTRDVVTLPKPSVTVEPAPAPARSGGAVVWVAVVLATAAAAAAGMWGYQQFAATTRPASLTLQTTPPGLQVSIDGRQMGTTPLTVSLPAGEYPVTLARPEGGERSLSVTLAAGASVVQHVEMPPAPAPAAVALTGNLHIETNPAGQGVLVDGIARGNSPVTVPALSVGTHTVVVQGRDGNIQRTINVEAGQTVSLVVAGPQVAPTRAGWVSFSSPVPLELRENGRVIGTSEAERLMLPAGVHDIEMSNEALGFSAARRVTVTADRTTAVAVELPTGTVSINALPWAEVWLDGVRIGETPIANFSAAIGAHEVLLRHPQFGERRAKLTVSTKQTARLGVDMRTP
jgi:hypothetical protein